MARRAFFSFHYQPDNWRAGQVRQMGVIEGDPPVSDNDWETVKRGGDAAIARWIDRQLEGKSITIVLIGAQTASRKWVIHEIERSWNLGKAVLGIYIHGLKDRFGNTATKGANPFDRVSLGNRLLSSIVPVQDAIWTWDSKGVYATIKQGLPDWIENAIKIRQQHPGSSV